MSGIYGTYHIEFAYEKGHATILRLSLVYGMLLKELTLSIKRLLDWLQRVDVALTTSDNRDVAQT